MSSQSPQVNYEPQLLDINEEERIKAEIKVRAPRLINLQTALRHRVSSILKSLEPAAMGFQIAPKEVDYSEDLLTDQKWPKTPDNEAMNGKTRKRGRPSLHSSGGPPRKRLTVRKKSHLVTYK